MKSYLGSCHCGAIKFTFTSPGTSPGIVDAIRCNCSICIRKGSIMTSATIPPDAIEISAQGDALQVYQFATMSARHHFCATCGIHTFVETSLNPGHYRINLGCVDGLDALDLPEKIYDGKRL